MEISLANSAYEKAVKLTQKYITQNFNEADTRHKIIDEVIHSILCWPKELVKRESYINPGYADYRLIKATGDDLLFIESKREGEYFSLPNNFNNHLQSNYISIRAHLKNGFLIV
ncbi:MAG: hypothetical protein M0R68_01675 [Bacteroidetes bacterium]|nr:hypothetical protein [Bacteroidota bacterium]